MAESAPAESSAIRVTCATAASPEARERTTRRQTGFIDQPVARLAWVGSLGLAFLLCAFFPACTTCVCTR